MKQIGKKLSDGKGLALLVVLMAVLAAGMFVLVIVYPLYLKHLEDAKLTLDTASVNTAREVAAVTYLQDGASGLKIYYYDELSHKCLPRERVEEIQPYGRSSRDRNEKGETGARGIPHLDGQSQLLAVAVSDSNILNVRWTGKDWRYLDYYYMYPTERMSLTAGILRAMDKDTVKRAEKAALAQYRKDFRKRLKKGEDPGEALYDYSAVNDFVFYDRAGRDPEHGGVILPGKAQPGKTDNLAAYGLMDEAQDKVLQVKVSSAGEKVESAWVQGDV